MNEMTPEEIKDIRITLGLTQVEAGELLAGGPRAFTKYEAGTVRPSASVVRLLRLLEADPGMISVLGGDSGPGLFNMFGVGPFEVSGQQIQVLRPEELADLLRRLLVAEARSHGYPSTAYTWRAAFTPRTGARTAGSSGHGVLAALRYCRPGCVSSS